MVEHKEGSSVRQRRFRWRSLAPTDVTPQHKEVFISMMLRRKRRQLNGAQQREGKYHFLLVIILVVVIYASYGATSDSNGLSITLDGWQIVLSAVWVAIIVMVSSIIRNTKFITVFNWCLIYIPLLAILASLLFQNKAAIESGTWIFILFLIAEGLAVSIYLLIHHVQPWLLSTTWYREKKSHFWSINVISDWTMTYRYSNSWYSCVDSRHTCKFVGDLDSNGLPHGIGEWLDDSYDGEVLTGKFVSGKPVAPFLSRQYGTGDSFAAIPIFFFVATDDGFGANNLFPTNNGPSQYGVASVECSVHGAFYNHLPEASVLDGPHEVNNDSFFAACSHQLSHLETKEEHDSLIRINANDPRGVRVEGHVYSETGLPFSKKAKEVVVDVECASEAPATNYSGKFMPRASDLNKPEHILVREENINDILPQDPQERDVESSMAGNHETFDSENASQPLIKRMEDRSRDSSAQRLVVRDWDVDPQKDALVYIPGFNSWAKQSLETLGQFLAMGNLSEKVYPILFDWPNGQIATYLAASKAAATDRNEQKLLELLKGISAAGIRNVHFMTHSMGVQTLLGAFQDKEKGGRGDVSLCFQGDPSICKDDTPENDSLLICKSITLLNPDFPVDAFVEHAFLSIRRVCNHITLVADKSDQALFFSQLLGGLVNYWKIEHPCVLDGNTFTQKGFHYRRVIGREVDSIYIPDEEVKDSAYEKSKDMHTSLLFHGAPPLVISSSVEEGEEKLWLDLDVIDTTSLDININNLRHGGFQVNPILFNDLEELIVSGQRANKRSNLLHREGNIYSYCHAPSFVAM